MIVLLAVLSAHAGGPPSCPTPPGPIDGAEHLFDIHTFGTQIEIVPTVDAYWPCAYAVRWSVLRGDETLHDLPVGRSLVDVGEYGEYTVVLRAETLGGVGEEAVTVTLEPDKNGCSTVHPRGGLAVLGLVIATAFRRRTRGRKAVVQLGIRAKSVLDDRFPAALHADRLGKPPAPLTSTRRSHKPGRSEGSHVCRRSTSW